MLSEYQRSSIFTKAVNIIIGSKGQYLKQRGTTGESGFLTTVRQLIRQYVPNPEPSDYTRVGNVLNQAQRAVDYGKAIQAGEADAARPPIDYSAASYGGRFVYRVVASYFNPKTRKVQTSYLTVTSESPLTGNELDIQTRMRINELLRLSGSDNEADTVRPGDVDRVYVLTGGRA